VNDNPAESAPEPAEPQGEHLPELTSEAKNWAVLCHLSALFGFLGPGFGHLIGPVLVWLFKRHDHPFIDENGKESVNFQISITIYAVLISPTVCVAIGIPLLIALFVANVILVVLAAIRASNGELYHYPLCLRLIK
jgi:uncharacterized protein